jgi:hypothetical protein
VKESNIPTGAVKTAISEDPRTESGTPKDPNTPLDPDLGPIHDRWSKLPEYIQAAVKALIDAHHTY